MKRKEARDIILRPLISEKGTRRQQADNQVTFAVHREANKIEIKRAIEEIFKVKVEGVNTLVMAGKTKRVRMVVGRLPRWKKAIVTLRAGESIEIFEGV